MAKKKEQSLEQMFEQIDEVIMEMESDLAFDDAIVKYSNAMRLINLCSEKLNAVKLNNGESV